MSSKKRVLNITKNRRTAIIMREVFYAFDYSCESFFICSRKLAGSNAPNALNYVTNSKKELKKSLGLLFYVSYSNYLYATIWQSDKVGKLR